MPDELNLAWLHCNHCHRAFDHHNRLSDRRLIKSDLHFNFCSCGHVLCDHCVALHTNGQGLTCPSCREMVQPHRLESSIPKGLEMYLKVPSLEDAQAVFTFQIGNANQLIKALRGKVASQRELLAKARHELVDHKALKERLAEVQAENDGLKERIRQFTRDTSLDQPSRHQFDNDRFRNASSHHFNASVDQRIRQEGSTDRHPPGRLSLRSPILSRSPSLSRLHLEMPVYQSPVRQPFPPPPTPSHSGFYPSGGGRRSNYFRQ